jgi:membrane associated rhomboid family serine protease
LALAITGTIFVITDVLFGVPWAAAIAAIFAGVLVWLWYGLPLSRRIRDEQAR